MEGGKKLERVSGRQYNMYLKRKDPLSYAPESSKRYIQQLSSPSTTDSAMSNSTYEHEHYKEDESSDIQQATTGIAESQEMYENSESPLSDSSPSENTEREELEEMLHSYEKNHEHMVLFDEYLEDDQNEDPVNILDDNPTSTEGDQPVFPGSHLKLGASMLLIMTFALKYSLTGEGLSDLLTLINLHCPVGNLLTHSVVSFKKWFQHIKHPLKVHKYCSFCNLLLSNNDLENGVCPNGKCRSSISNDTGLSHFIEIPIADQIKSFFSKPSFIEDIKYRFKRTKKAADAIEDIYDGTVYTSLSQNGQLADPNNLSLLWNTDGIPCFKSSHMSLWPLFFQINELHYTKRSCPENMILGGLWFGPKKPIMMSYTEPFVKTLRSMETDGINIDTGTTSFNCKVFVIGGTADLPARCVVCNTVQFNGKYGCCKCLQPGETHKTSARGHVHIFPFKDDDASGPKRTQEETMCDVENAIETGVPCRGVKGPSFLHSLLFYNIISGTCIDYMHGVLLGVTKLLLSLWFSSEHLSQPFSLYASVDLVDKRLTCLKPPNNITRLPRSIKDHMKYWKASELRSWLLYYSLPILRDIQEHEYFQHYLLFVNAIYLLLQDSISESDLEQANSLLMHFCCLFAALYNDRYMTCNIHQLLHLSEMVRDMGPLWVYSCFSFENANGKLLKLYNGTQNVDFQIVEAINLTQNMPYLQRKFLTAGSPECRLYEKMKGLLARSDTHLYGNIYIVGGIGKATLDVAELNAVAQFLGHIPIHYSSFNRIRIGGEIFHSKKYKRVRSRNSYTVAYSGSEGEILFCQIILYLKLYQYCQQHSQVSNICNCNVQFVALGMSMKKSTDNTASNLSTDELTHANVSHINVLCPSNVQANSTCICIIPLHKILHKCVLVEILDRSDVVYACKMPNSLEKD